MSATRRSWLPGMALMLLLASGCSSTSTVLLTERGEGDFRGGTAIAPRPGQGDVAYLAKSEILCVNDEGRLDHLLLEEEGSPTIIDLVFRSPEELLVLRPEGISVYFGGRLLPAWKLSASHDARIAASGAEIWASLARGRWSRNSTTLCFMPRLAKCMARSRRSLAITLLRSPVAPSRDGPNRACVVDQIFVRPICPVSQSRSIHMWVVSRCC